MKIVVAATGTSVAARPSPQAAPDADEEEGGTILCGPCGQGGTQAGIDMAITKKDVDVVSIAECGDAGMHGASFARNGDAKGEKVDANCSDTS